MKKSIFNKVERKVIIKQAKGIQHTFGDSSFFKALRYVLKWGIGSEILKTKIR